ncbi:hypothetical protein PsorP6_001614 [Peronosclerospora sorghi]|uniref:Uncharacterized protein n=1 Tax=Peronosclerospora sorghi TaxID=230839 RepID=A0ACC0WWK5_9STRA|nr:hypothetical protein PsorP6_001614 [Peronosclerospora sorghi]
MTPCPSAQLIVKLKLTKLSMVKLIKCAEWAFMLSEANTTTATERVERKLHQSSQDVEEDEGAVAAFGKRRRVRKKFQKKKAWALDCLTSSAKLATHLNTFSSSSSAGTANGYQLVSLRQITRERTESCAFGLNDEDAEEKIDDKNDVDAPTFAKKLDHAVISMGREFFLRHGSQHLKRPGEEITRGSTK